jgi:outer membrane protein W
MPTTRRILLLAFLSLAGCRSRTADLGMSDSAFVLVMSELKVVADESELSNEVKAQRRDAIMRKRGVSAKQLEGLAATLTAHPNHAKKLWAAIDMKSLALVQKPK